MSHTFLIVPTTRDVNLQTTLDTLDSIFTAKNLCVTTLPGANLNAIEYFLITKHREQLLEELVLQYETASPHHQILVLPGIPLDKNYAPELNFSIAVALGATILFVLATEENNFVANLYSIQISTQIYRHNYPHIACGLILVNCHQQLVTLTVQYQKLLREQWPLIFNLQEKASLEKIYTLGTTTQPLLTPPIFKHRLLQKACSQLQTIVLPEGDEPCIVTAANICAKRKIACCILLAAKDKVEATCANLKLTLHPAVEILDPQTVNKEKYAAALYEARRAKGLTLEAAHEQLQDNTLLGTMMLYVGEVNGLVSGAIHTTADTIRPALQIIKTARGVKRVSSLFFMCLPSQVLIYADCAVSTDPTAEELAEIAIQSAVSAAEFGITPKIAMLSYSTGNSGSGPSVEKVKKATEIVKTIRPDLIIEGPMQFDAAMSAEVARIKCPLSKVAGKANVFIVPNLDVGNILYKAVQWGAHVMCIGPMLQGLNKAVNDLSRGCKVEDIVFTIAITAIQAQQLRQNVEASAKPKTNTKDHN